jgi:hypothetical protein
MSRRKARLTVTVDQAWVEAGSRAVKSGRADSLSGWVNRALAQQVSREGRLQAMGQAIALFEAKFGEISADELARQLRADRGSAVIVRGRGRAERRRRGAA